MNDAIHESDKMRVTLVPFKIREEATIPRRPWLMTGLLLRKQVAAMIAAGGVGKSVLTLTIALHLCAGRDFGPWRCAGGKRYRVGVLSAEEDEDELDRRLHAIAAHYGFTDEDAENLFIYAADALPVLAEAGRNGIVKETAIAQKVAEHARQEKLDVIILDPLAEIVQIPENDNGSMKAACAILRQIARRLDIGILLTHHVRKGGVTPGDVDAARGASSLIGLVRTACTLVPMATDEAAALDLDPDEAAGIFRADDGKANYSAMRGRAFWFRLKSVALANGTGDAHDIDADDCGVPVAWVPRNALGEKSIQQIHEILDLIEKGIPGNGDRYGFKKSGGSARWVGYVLTREWDWTTAQATDVIDAWRKSGLLYEDTFMASKSRGPKLGVFVNPAKKPSGSMPW